MVTTILFATPYLLYLCAFCQATAGGESKLLPPKAYHHPRNGATGLERLDPGAGGPSWDKRPFGGSDRPDYYGFLTDGRKRFGGGHRSEDDYLGFLVGDKRNGPPDYWNFLGVDGVKRTQKRKKRSVGEKRNPATELDEKKIRGSSADRRSPHDDLESWDDFVLGKRRAPGDGHDMSFDDFLLGKRRHDNDRFSDYDYSEFVLGKRS